MDKAGIITELALGKTAEQLTASEARRFGMEPSADYSDISQMAYLALLEMEDATVVRLHESGELGKFLRGIIRNMITQERGEYQKTFGDYRRRAVPLEGERDD